jgi:tetratricopeptide (TPR) repeat protein
LLLNVSGVIYTYLNEYARAREVFTRLLARPNLAAGSKYLFMNNVAYADVLLDDPALLPEADGYSAAAYKNIPWEPAIQGTRGLVLVLLGNPGEGLPLLRGAFGKHTNNRSKAADACYIALGEFRQGNRDAAQKYLDAARSLDPECPVIARIEREMAG